jgi:hypothetical protein
MSLVVGVRVAALWACALVVAGCSKTVAEPLAKAPSYEPKGQSKCSVAMSQDKPLIVEWPSADRAQLEARAKSGGVVLRVEGCELEMLPRCEAPGTYAYTSVAPKQDIVRIRDLDELYAQVPVGAYGLEGALASAGELTIDMMMVGRVDTDTPIVTANELEGDCSGATHVMTGMTIGAFEFFAGARGEAGASVRVGPGGAGGRGEHVEETLTRDGSLSSCVESDSPPRGCSAPLRIEVARLGWPRDHRRTLRTSACPEGTELEGENCVRREVVTQTEVRCPSGSHWDGSNCVALAPDAHPVTPLYADDEVGTGWACYVGKTSNGVHGECHRDLLDCGVELHQRKRDGRLESDMTKCERQNFASCFQVEVDGNPAPKPFCFPGLSICERNLADVAELDRVKLVSECGTYG